MRIVHVVPRFRPAIGGMENYVYNIALGLRAHGHEVLVVTSDDAETPTKETEIMSGMPIYRYPLLFGRPLREYWLLSGVGQALANLDPDVVHAHGYRCLSSFIAVSWCKSKRIPVVLTPHGIYPPRSFGNALIKGVYDRSVGNLLLKSSTRIVALTENNMQLLLRIGAPMSRLVLIPTGVDVKRFGQLGSLRTTKKEKGSTGPVLLYIGRVDWNKGLERVVEALPLLLKEFDQMRFVIVGPDYAGYSSKLLNVAYKHCVHHSMVLTGRVGEDQILSYYSIADIFILPSVYEGLSLSLLEAMASHVPVIASKSGGSGDVLTNGENAMLLKDCSQQEIYGSVLMLLRNPELAQKVSCNAFKLVSEGYDWQVVAGKMERLYREICYKS